MNSIKNISLSLRIILSFGATGLVLILLALFLTGKLRENSIGLNDKLAGYEDTNQLIREVYSISFKIESATDYQPLASEFTQKLSAAKAKADADQLSRLEEISVLWGKAQFEKSQEASAGGRPKQQELDSLRADYSSIQSKLASCLASTEDDFARGLSGRISGIASLERSVWYLAYCLIFVLIVGGLFWYYSITSPLKLLMEATRKISMDVWGTRVEIDSRDEFGKLGESFNEMSANIARLAAFLDAVGNPVYAVDERYTLRFANAASLGFAGVRREDVILKKKCHDVFKLSLCQTEDCPVKKAWKGQGMITGETVASPKNYPVPVLYQSAAVSEMGGQLSRGVEVLTDISQMKKVSTEIEEQREYLSESVNVLLEKMTNFADGDLSIELDEKNLDDIGKLYAGFNKSIVNIRAMIEQLMEAVESTASASTQIRTSIEELAAGAGEQSSQSNDVAAAVEEMTRSVTDSAKNAAKVEQAARENGRVAQSGGEIVQRTVLKMKEIAGVVKKSSETINQLGELSTQISEIISVIDDIANQTNLLALNAAIEAARAGEEGRGFAVVADEVRKLAERTTQATKQISSMIKNVQASTSEAVDAMRTGIQEVTAGLVLADEAGLSLNDIVGNAHSIVDMISQIAVANEEQSSTSSEISKSIELISAVSSQSANGISKIARAADDLNKLTSNLQTLITKFNLTKDKNVDSPVPISKGSPASAKLKQDYERN